jgi:hypothetical protein
MTYHTTDADLRSLLHPTPDPIPRPAGVYWAVVRVRGPGRGGPSVEVLSWHRSQLRAAEYLAVYARGGRVVSDRLALLHVAPPTDPPGQSPRGRPIRTVEAADPRKVARCVRLVERFAGPEGRAGGRFARSAGRCADTGVPWIRLRYCPAVPPTYRQLALALGVYDLDKAVQALDGAAPIPAGSPPLPLLLARLYPARFGSEWGASG